MSFFLILSAVPNRYAGKFAARDEPPDLLLAEAQILAGLLDGEEARLLRFFAVDGRGVHRIDLSPCPRGEGSWLVSEVVLSGAPR